MEVEGLAVVESQRPGAGVKMSGELSDIEVVKEVDPVGVEQVGERSLPSGHGQSIDEGDIVRRERRRSVAHIGCPRLLAISGPEHERRRFDVSHVMHPRGSSATHHSIGVETTLSCRDRGC
jgi:hypothetical protein